MVDICRTQQMLDIIHGTIQYSGLENAVISTPIFNRLHRVLQSSMVYLTYSSNKVKRFEHSIGTMHLAGQIMYKSVLNSNKDIIEAMIKEMSTEAIKWYRNVNFTNDMFLSSEISDVISPDGEDILTASYPSSTFYKENTPSNLDPKDKLIYLATFQALRLAALLHDVGHLPYSHVVEDAIRTLFLQVDHIEEGERSGAQKEFIRIISPYYGAKDDIHAIHEEIGKQLVSQIKTGISKNAQRNDDSDKIFLGLVFHLASKILESSPEENTVFSDLHWIFAGTIDADRLDYCSRDLFCSGSNRDVFPYQRIISTYKVIQRSLVIDEPGARKHFLFCPAAKSLQEIEMLLERRRIIFSQINYHHRVHKHEILFSDVLAHVGFDELTNKDKLPVISNDNAVLPLEAASIWVLLDKLQQKRQSIEYLVIQLDDSWMDTLLKNAFFTKYKSSFRNLKVNGSNPNWNRFDELISATKHYFSCFKRTSDFREFDKNFCILWNDAHGIDLSAIEPIKQKALANVNAQIENYKSNKAQVTFAFNYLLDAFYGDSYSDFFRELEETLNGELKKKENLALNINDCFVRSCRFSLGYDTNTNPVYFWINDENASTKTTTLRLEQLSIQRDMFTRKRELAPSFHLYYLPRYDSENLKVLDIQLRELLDLLARVSIDIFHKKIVQA